MATSLVKQFRIGDEVKVKADLDSKTFVIMEVALTLELSFEYITTAGKWFKHSELELVKPATKKSLAVVLVALQEEEF